MMGPAPPIPREGAPARRPRTGPWIGPPTGLGIDRPGTAWAGLIEVDGRTAMFVEVGSDDDADRSLRPTERVRHAEAEAEVVAGAFTQAAALGVPVLAVVRSLLVGPHDLAAERGYVDQVIAPETTRAHLVAALARLAGKRPHLPGRRHSISPC